MSSVGHLCFLPFVSSSKSHLSGADSSEISLASTKTSSRSNIDSFSSDMPLSDPIASSTVGADNAFTLDHSRIPAEMFLNTACLPLSSSKGYTIAFQDAADDEDVPEVPSAFNHESRRLSTASSVFSFDEPIVFNTEGVHSPDFQKRVASINAQESCDTTWLESDAYRGSNNFVERVPSIESFVSDASDVEYLDGTDGEDHESVDYLDEGDPSSQLDETSTPCTLTAPSPSILSISSVDRTESGSRPASDDDLATDVELANSPVEKLAPLYVELHSRSVRSASEAEYPAAMKDEEYSASIHSESSMDSDDTAISVESEQSYESSSDCESPSTIYVRCPTVDPLVKATIESSSDVQDIIRILGYTLGDDILPKKPTALAHKPYPRKNSAGRGNHRFGTLLRSFTMSGHNGKRRNSEGNSKAINISSPYNFRDWKETVEQRGYGVENVRYHNGAGFSDSNKTLDASIPSGEIDLDEQPLRDSQDTETKESISSQEEDEVDVDTPSKLSFEENKKMKDVLGQITGLSIDELENGLSGDMDASMKFLENASFNLSNDDSSDLHSAPILGSVKRRSNPRPRSHSLCHTTVATGNIIRQTHSFSPAIAKPLTAIAE